MVERRPFPAGGRARIVAQLRNMTDWKKIASGREAGIPEADLDRVVESLKSLEEVFRPLAQKIAHDVEPAVTFHAAQGEDE